MKYIHIMIGLCMLALTNSAFALIVEPVGVGYTEGRRAQVANTMLISGPDSPNNPPGFDLGSLNNPGDFIGLHGRIVNAADAYQFTSDTAFRIDFIFGGFDLAAGGSVDASGFTFDEQGKDINNTSDFSLYDGVDTQITRFVTEITDGDSLIFSAGPGDYVFTIDGIRPSGGALYDVVITAVPLPAALPLLLGGVSLLGVFGRKKKAELV